MVTPDYQLVILGGGPAGLTAGLYAARARLKTLLVEKGVPGGQILVTDWIDNYPGFPDGISGADLAEKMAAQAGRFGLESRYANVVGLELDLPVKKLLLEDGESIGCHCLIICSGARPNSLGVPGETELTGKGVSYCATCDGPFFKDVDIAIVGGGDTAVQEAVFLARFARKVTVIHRRRQLRAAQILQEKALAEPKVNFLYDTVVTSIEGKGKVEGIMMRNTVDGKVSAMAVDGVFILIGTRPNNEMIPCGEIGCDEWGFIRTDDEMLTQVPGIMAAGDIRSKSVRQVVNAAGEGAVAAVSAAKYLEAIND